MSTTRTEPERPARNRKAIPTFDLSPAQLIATALAAVVATFAASFLGVTGTVVGAALFSVITAIGKEIFGTSLRHTGSRVRESSPVTRVLPRVPATDDTDTDPGDSDEAPPELPSPAPGPGRGPAWRRVALVSSVIFVGVLACVTAVEVFAGRPVSDIVRGDAGNGTSFFGNQQVKTQTVPPTAPTAPTVTVTVTPKVVVTTPTQTQTAPPVIKSTTPTQTTTAPSSPSSAAPSTTPSSTVTTAPRP